MLEEALAVLKRSDKYRIIERYEPPLYYHEEDGSPKLKGIFLDVETTGLNIPIDKIIELGLVVFEYGADGRIFKILETISQYQDPGKPIPPEITELTGITNAKVKGCSLDKKNLLNTFHQADLIIAHYATFDRACMEALWQELPLKPWACSMREISWQTEGIESAKLEYLAYRYGFFYEGHRASTDCLAGVHLLSQTLPRSQKLVLKALLESSQQPIYRIWALGASIAHKDILRRRQYRWNPEGRHRAWSIEVSQDNLLTELQFLWHDIYAHKACLPVEEIPAKHRYSQEEPLQHWIESASQVRELS